MKDNKFGSLISALLACACIAAAAFLTACNNAAAPRPLSGSEVPVAASAANRPPANEEAIKNAMDVPIAKLDGSSFKLDEYRGKVLLVDFWGTFCGPCVKQVPELVKLNEKYRERGLALVGLTADPKSDQDKVEEFIKRFGVNYQIGYDNNWIASAFLKGTEDDTGDPPIPQLFVISRDGRIVEHLIGEQPGRMQYLEKVVLEQLNAAQ